METELRNATEEILRKLAKLQLDINYLKNHARDEDGFLTKEEGDLLDESYEDEKDGRLVSSKQVKEEFEI